MGHYKAPLREIQFVANEMLQLDQFYRDSDTWAEVTPDLVNAIIDEAAKFTENVLAPLNPVGDTQGCTLKDGVVTTPDGFKDAYQQFVAGGWTSLEGSTEFGGQNMPKSLSIAVTEMIGAANWSWAMYHGLSRGACHTLEHHGTDDQKQTFLTRLIDGTWTGTMCLTEPHCGSDLGMLRTKAEPRADGSYSISGTKIFISSGEHDLAENIIHIVLARLPDAPEGTKGISLFIVPRVNVNEDGSLGERNAVTCGSLEEKMGIHGNATCVMNFDGARGFLIGPENRGLNCMFTFMNLARIGTAVQGLAHAEFAYQNSLAYARERLQMRALSGPKAPDKAADPIIVHPDVRRMLLTQKAFAEGGRMLIYYVCQVADRADLAPSDEARKPHEDLLALLTPIAKAFMTETGFEAANHGLQVFGGHGYIREWGMEQNVRDARIAMLYEGTTGIQALDLLGRKVMMSAGELLKAVIEPMTAFCRDNGERPDMAPFVVPLQQLISEWSDITGKLGARAMENPDEINAACVDYLMYSGYAVYAWLFAQAARVAQDALAAGDTTEAGFYRAKVYLAQFYFQRLLPRTRGHAESMLAGLETLYDESVDPFC